MSGKQELFSIEKINGKKFGQVYIKSPYESNVKSEIESEIDCCVNESLSNISKYWAAVCEVIEPEKDIFGVFYDEDGVKKCSVELADKYYYKYSEKFMSSFDEAICLIDTDIYGFYPFEVASRLSLFLYVIIIAFSILGLTGIIFSIPYSAETNEVHPLLEEDNDKMIPLIPRNDLSSMTNDNNESMWEGFFSIKNLQLAIFCFCGPCK
jgi:hypothetical protein